MHRRDVPPAVVDDSRPPALDERSDVRGVDVLLTLDEVAAIYRLSTTTIRTRLQRGTFRPLPWDKYPYRWSKEEIRRDLALRRHDQNVAPHGYAARPPVRTVKATSRPRRMKPPKAVNE